jgi:hypothetical protein
LQELPLHQTRRQILGEAPGWADTELLDARDFRAEWLPIMKSILSVVTARVSPDAERIKTSWRALPIESVELSRDVSYGY